MANDVLPTQDECNSIFLPVPDSSCIPVNPIRITPEFISQLEKCQTNVYNKYATSQATNYITKYSGSGTQTADTINTFFGFTIMNNDLYCSEFCPTVKSGTDTNAQAVCGQVCTKTEYSSITITEEDVKIVPDYQRLIGECLKALDETNKSAGTPTEFYDIYINDYQSWKLWQDMSMNCFRKELCKNRNNAATINQIQNNHLGSDQNYVDANLLYNNEYIKTANLTIGILAIMAAIFYSK